MKLAGIFLIVLLVIIAVAAGIKSRSRGRPVMGGYADGSDQKDRSKDGGRTEPD